MRELLILLLIGGVAYLAYDDYLKRDALKQTQEEMQRLTAERGQLRQTPGRTSTYVAPTYVAPTPPGWFQERLNERPSMDESGTHRQGNTDASQSHYPTPKPQ